MNLIYEVIRIRIYKSLLFSRAEIFRWVINSGTESELFLELLKAIRVSGERVQHQVQVIPQVMTLIQEISVKIASLTVTAGVNNLIIAEQWTDRLFQLIQILISVGCLDGNEIRKLSLDLKAINPLVS
jgi:hypothetical protein